MWGMRVVNFSAGTICGEDGPNSASCKGAEKISIQVGHEEAADHTSGCKPIVDIARAIGLDALANGAMDRFDRDRLGYLSVALGAIALVVAPESAPDEASSLEGLNASKPTSLSQQIGQLSGVVAVAIDAGRCAQNVGWNSSCVASSLGVFGVFLPGDTIDGYAGWVVSAGDVVRNAF